MLIQIQVIYSYLYSYFILYDFIAIFYSHFKYISIDSGIFLTACCSHNQRVNKVIRSLSVHQGAEAGGPRCSLPVALLAVFNHQLLELLVHLPVEVVPQEEGPEAEQRVHLLRLADPQALAL